MHRLPSDLLLSIFKQMNSKDMVLKMQVCRDWLEIIDENTELWRRLVLPKMKNGWELSILQLFDKRSGSRLKEVSMELTQVSQNLQGLMEIMEKSKDTLRTICIYHSEFVFYLDFGSILSEFFLRMPNLTSYRLINTFRRQPVHIRSDRVFLSQNTHQDAVVNQDAVFKFKILWGVRPASLLESIKLSPLRLNCLASLVVRSLVKSSELITILKHFSQALKHLEIKVDDLDNPIESIITWNPVNLSLEDFPLEDHSMRSHSLSVLPAVYFPSLQVLDIYCRSGCFPSWMRCPILSSLIIRNVSLLEGSPEISKLSVAGINNFSRLMNSFPSLDEVRLECTLQVIEHELLDESLRQSVFDTLRHRRHFSNLVRDLGGVSRMLIKRIVFPFELLDEEKLAELKDLADEVVDLDVAPRFIEMEI